MIERTWLEVLSRLTKPFSFLKFDQKPKAKGEGCFRGVKVWRQLLRGAAGFLAVVGAVIVVGETGTASAPSRPNVVVIVLDDVGFSDLGCYGSEIHTPNLDRLAAQGLRYVHFDTKAVCSSTRASLLTGRNSHTVRMADLPSNASQPVSEDQSSSKGEMPANAETMAEALREAGYATHAIGKWHVSPDYEDGSERRRASWPLQRGFDSYYGFISGWTDQYRPRLVAGNRRIAGPTEPAYHLSVDLADRAVAVLNDHAQQKEDRPFLLYFAPGAAHAPYQAPEAAIKRYAGTYDVGWDVLRQRRFDRMMAMGLIPAGTKLPASNPGDSAWEGLSADEQKVYARFMAAYAGFLSHADEQIGRLLDRLVNLGYFDNTLFVVLSDNGAAPEGGSRGAFRHPYRDTADFTEMLEHLDEVGSASAQPLYQRPWAMLGSTPFRRYKLWPFAGGVRAPLMVTWPSAIAARGEIRSQFVDVIDLAPTILEAAGTGFRAAIEGVTQLPVAGKSIAGTFRRGAKASERRSQYFEFRGNRAITMDNWKAVTVHVPGQSFADDRWELFDLSADFSESMDLAAKYPDVLARLKLRWNEEAARYGVGPLKEMSPRLQGLHLFDDEYGSSR